MSQVLLTELQELIMNMDRWVSATVALVVSA